MYVKSLAFAPSNSQIVYASGRPESNQLNAKIYRSVDNGVSFSEVGDLGSLFGDVVVTKLVVHPDDESTVLALSGKDRFTSTENSEVPKVLYMSSSGGSGWLQVATSYNRIVDVVIHPTAPFYTYISDEIQGYFYETNLTNSSWNSVNTTAPFANLLWPLPGNAGLQIRIIDHTANYYAGGDGPESAWLVKNVSGNWQTDVLAVARDWTGADENAWQAGWAKTNEMFNGPFSGLNKAHGYNLSYNSDRIYRIGIQFIFKGSYDNVALNLDFEPAFTDESPIISNTWRSRGIDNITATLVVNTNTTDPDTVYIGLQDLGCFVSTDAGEYWRSCNYKHPGLTDWNGIDGLAYGGSVYSLLSDPGDATKVWMAASAGQRDISAASGQIKLLFSNDTGNSWNESIGLPVTADIYGLSIDTKDPDNKTLYITVDGDMYKTTDGQNIAGATWTAFYSPCDGGCRATAVDPVGNLYVGGEDGLFVYPADNSGWQTLMPVFNNSQDTFQHSSSWKGVTNIRPDLTTSGVVFVSIFQSADQNSDKRSGVYRCEIATGSCAQLLGNAEPFPFARDVAVDPSDTSILYATSSSAYTSGEFDADSKGVYRSTDGGANWTDVNEGLAWPFVVPVAISPAAPKRVFIGSPGPGYHKRDFSAPVTNTIVADYQDDFTEATPASGWSYQWNDSGVIGNAANYSALQWSGASYDGDSNNYPDTSGLNYGQLHSTGGHAGWGESDGASTDRFVIAGYTVTQSGTYNIINSFIDSNTGCQYSNGGELHVYVNDTPHTSFTYDKLDNNAFDATLGNLNAGDTIYVATGPNGTDGCDDFLLDYSIEHAGTSSTNNAPTLNPVINPRVEAGNSLTVSFSASDVDGDTLTYSISSNPDFGSLTDNGNGTASLQLDPTTADVGGYTVTISVSDGQASVNQSFLITVSGGTQAFTVSVSINHDDDDVEQKEGSGSIYFDSSDLELVYDDYNQQDNQTIGLRFNGVDIPQGATISGAHIEFTVDETSSGSTDLTITGQASDDASAFTTQNYDVSSRTTTSASVGWQPATWSNVGAKKQTTDLKFIVQEIVNRNGWAADNSMVFIITGTGSRTVESYDGSAGGAPKLVIDYTTGGGNTNQEPTLDPVSDLSITAGNSQTLSFNASDVDGDTLTYSISNNPAFGTLTDNGNGTASLQLAPVAADVGDYNVTVTVSDGSLSASQSFKITVTGGLQTLVVSIDDGNDDVEENENTGSIYFDSSDLELVYDDYNQQDNQTIGLRFNDIEIPQGATISGAHIEFTVDETSSGSTDLTITGQDSDEAPAFTTQNYDVSSRTATSASVGWQPAAWSTIGAKEQSTDLAVIVQEIVNRSGWTSNGSMVFIITGTGSRIAESYDGSASDAPKLVIDYTN